jgi:hypothetical protein
VCVYYSVHSSATWVPLDSIVCVEDLIEKPQTVCVECLIGKQKKPILFKVTDPSSVPYRAPSACAKRAAYPDPPPVIPLPDTGAAQVQTSPGRGLLAKQDRDD